MVMVVIRDTRGRSKGVEEFTFLPVTALNISSLKIWACDTLFGMVVMKSTLCKAIIGLLVRLYPWIG